METFKSRGMGYLESLTKEDLNNIILVANKQYHAFLEKNTPLTLTDHEYDIVKECLEKKHPDATALKEIGSEVVHSKQKVELPVNMPSMDKIKPDTDALDSWKKKYRGPYVLSCKLDGVSGLYYTMNNQTRLYTRGDGTIGQDITGVLNYIHLPQIPNVIIRGEFIIKKKEFETHYSKTASNIRNMVAGIINQKKHDPAKTKSVDFVAYEVIEPVLSPSQQMAFLKENHFNTVQHETTKMPTTTPATSPITTHTTITNETLSNTLVKWRAEYEYEIDGVIVANDAIYERTSTNPKHAFAFKMVISDQLAETQVTDVIWTPSKDGYLKPRVRVNPVKINGVKIEYVTGFNGQYISKNKIGIGAVIQLVRSGDVIPYIKSVVVPAETAKMPDVPYTWTESNIDILLSNKADDPVVLEKQITGFFTGLDVEGLSTGNVKRIMQAGYNTVAKIIKMSETDFLDVEGFKEKLASKVHSSIHEKIDKSNLVKILAASNQMGRGMGERKIKPILEAYPFILTSTETDAEKEIMLQKINGIGKENAKVFVENIRNALDFLSQCDLMHKVPTKQTQLTNPNTDPSADPVANPIINKDHPIHGKTVVFTGFRDKEMMKTLEEKYAVNVTTSITKNTYMVIVKTKTETNSKIDKANSMKIPILSIDELKEHISAKTN